MITEDGARKMNARVGAMEDDPKPLAFPHFSCVRIATPPMLSRSGRLIATLI